ncbi:TetR/AcrR family transcriptional regulator [Kibdelosporangium persicum]|uniref:TetR/AcrR family transcriptional regulator n=1 Tax=Kibdelosporangium persicum TaxID=2698649 RepID=UPI001563EEEF|nr:TetR/AcrR family transcriptional regulator [Kibdelosporangium persicum]
MPYRRTPRVQARMDNLRAAILAAGVELLAEQGYAGCSVAAVAARAGIATGSVYKHFASKAELSVELFRFVVNHEVDAVAKAAAQPGDLVDRIVSVAVTFASRALRSPRLAYALLVEPVDLPVEQERLVFRRAFRDIAAERIAHAVDAGALPAQNPEFTAAALIGAMSELLVGPLAERASEADVLPALTTFCLRALGGHT